MKFKYLGDKEEMNAFGYDFSGGNTPEVMDERIIAKLQGNGHFMAVEEGLGETGIAATEAVGEPTEGEAAQSAPTAVRRGRKKLTV